MSENKMNLDLFIQKSLKIAEERKKPFDLVVEGFEEGTISFNYPKNNQLLNYIDAAGRSATVNATGDIDISDMGSLIEASKELVYSCCPYIQSKELHEKLGIEDPLEIPIIIFGMDQTMDIASNIADRAKGNKIFSETVEAVKN